MSRREYPLKIVVNEISIQKVVIDPHYEEKHPDISDQVVLDLVRQLDGGEYEPEKVMPSGFSYFVEEALKLENKTYRLIWLLKDDEVFIGVVNCYRRD